MSENQVITNMENEVEEMTAIHYLNQDNAVFERTEGGFLSLSYEEVGQDSGDSSVSIY